MSTNSHSHHIVSTKFYIFVFLALVFLTVLTVYTAKYVDLGSFNLALAMAIALVKATLVILLFMGLYWDRERISSFSFGFALVFVGIYMGLTLIDITTRGKISSTDAVFSDGYAPRVEGVVGSGSDREQFITVQELLELRRQIAAGEKPNLDFTATNK